MKYLSQAFKNTSATPKTPNTSSETLAPGSKAFVRADLDIPLSDNGEILEDYRLEVLLPTLKLLIENEIHPVIAGHMGRPKKTTPKLSTKNLEPFFNQHLGSKNYTLLENLRFDSREKGKDLAFAKELAKKADFYVNESFGNSHRADTSMALVPKILPGFAGLRLEKEITEMEKLLKIDTSARPLFALVGGVKNSKKEAIYALAKHFDYVLVGGALKKDSSDPANSKVLYPQDYSHNGLDIGPLTIKHYSEVIKKAATIIWAGPMGAYDQGYAEGSQKIAEAVLASPARSVVGGGDTVSCLDKLGLLDSFDFVSTGGGAMLDFLSGKKLPALAALGYYD
ncbi:phosphoglycerate kinase [candidate division WWE3 bacterium]|nr:phosphoglycerate kinase [candidate division WWE3 bacterium]